MGKTVTTYFIDGKKPNGIQYSCISNRICQMFVVPRLNKAYLKEQEKLQKPAFYVLVGADETNSNLAYIGETENFIERVKDHDVHKSFWQKAYIFVSKDADMTKSDVQYLEYRGIETANQAHTYILKENKQIPKEPNLPEYQKDSMDEFFEDIKFLMSFSGCNIFDIDKNNIHIFNINTKRCKARGFNTPSGFVVLQGSIIASDVVNSFTGKDKRNLWIKENTTCNNNGELVLNSDQTFTSPSSAASYCMGSSANGWTAWKDDEGLNLDQCVDRKKLE